MLYMPFTDGGPMYCLMSALSTNAKSIFSVTLDVVRITTLGCLQYEPKVNTKKLCVHLKQTGGCLSQISN